MSYPDFPSRNDIKNKSTFGQDYQKNLIDSIRGVDVNNYDFKNGNFEVEKEVVEEQKVFFWIRLFLTDEIQDLKPDDDIIIKYNYSSTGENLETKFICYAKVGAENAMRPDVDQITEYTPEDNKKVLCLMVDSNRINKNSDDIPFIRTLFKISRYYEYQLMRRDDLSFINKRTGEKLDYFDVDF